MGARKYSENNENSGFREGETWVINGWQLDEKCHCLIQGEDVVRLEPKITQLMAYLAARAGEPISLADQCGQQNPQGVRRQ
jgi:DNA-binding response OmpR family regulator